MKRLIKWNDDQSENKYVLINEYQGFGIYQEQSPSGYFVSQSWLISNNQGAELVIESYNNLCRAEVLDIIDNYNETGRFGVKALTHKGELCMHPSGTLV